VTLFKLIYTKYTRKEEKMNQELHVIFGAGQVGVFLAEILLAAGNRVRIVKRKQGILPAAAEVMLGDVTDTAFCRQACLGATVVYHCMNPEYSAKAWEEALQPYMDNLIDAAGIADARLVVLDNLYMLGRTGGKPMNENTPHNPSSRKGKIRARVAESLFEAHKQGKVRAVCGRAADFYGPRGKMTYFGDYFWKPVLAGKTVMTPINIDVLHTYHYIPDVAQGLATLGKTHDDSVFGRAWMLPCQPATTTRALAKRFEPFLNQSIQMKVLPSWLLKPLGVFMPMMRELKEMIYQWDEPFIVDDSQFRARFDVSLVTVDEAARATLAWAKDAYK
jgi:nucleoside-diphosphate-sugar epimerase